MTGLLASGFAGDFDRANPADRSRWVFTIYGPVDGALAREILDDASLLDDIPNGCALFLLPTGEPDFLERSIELGIAAIRQGRNVYFKHVPAGYGDDAVGEDESGSRLPPATWTAAS